MNNTSLNTLNADKGLTKLQSIRWFLLNMLDNYWMPNLTCDKSLVIQQYIKSISEKQLNGLLNNNSPSRRLCGLFWSELPWQTIKRELGDIRAFDIGCNDGKLGLLLQSYSNGSIAHYSGADIKRNDSWDRLLEKDNFSFHQINCNNILTCIPKDTNFIITQSAVEHFEEDLSFFKQIHEFISDGSQNVIQVHMIPSCACLKLYLLHGVRQYTPRKISKITKIFQDYSYSVLYELGGKYCNRLHWKLITKPLINKTYMPNNRTAEYTQKSNLAIQKDMSHPCNTPSFYALVIHSSWTNKIF